MKYPPKQEQELMSRLWQSDIKNNPYNFVMFAFPWGKPGTPLERFSGPRGWQKEELLNVADQIKKNVHLSLNAQIAEIYKSATSSGRGPGKSAFTAWLVLWMLSCHPGSTTIVTANTESQLKTKTWGEVGKWHAMAINAHWFEKMSMALKPQDWFSKLLADQLQIDSTYYYAQAILWSEENPDAFAGAHSHIGVLVIFDEASGIPPAIWTVTEGFFTEPTNYRFWFCFSNPRRNTGMFFECFHKYRGFWRTRFIDSRSVEGMDTKALQNIVDQYGEDSDEARVEVKGEFPNQSDKQFISRDIVEAAQERELVPDQWAPLIMGVDPARFGRDKTVIRFRQGRNGKVIPPIKLKSMDNMVVANTCADLIGRYNPDAVCIDAGNGTGIIDRLRERGFKVHEIWFGKASPEPEWKDMRTYMWAKMREWLKGATIDDDRDLKTDLVTPEYKFVGKGSDVITLESKEEIKSRGFHSPDDGDALACTFAVNVPRNDLKTARNNPSRHNRFAKDVDYDIFGG